MQVCPPRYRRETETEREERLEWQGTDPLPPKPKARRKKRELDTEPVFDVRRWRLPSRWRNDKRVGDVTISKMLRGIDLARYEELSA